MYRIGNELEHISARYFRLTSKEASKRAKRDASRFWPEHINEAALCPKEVSP